MEIRGCAEGGTFDAQVAFLNAVVGDSVDAMRAAVRGGASPQLYFKKRLVPMHIARSADMVRALIELGIDVESTDERGCTALHSAAARGALDVARCLCDHGADLNAASTCGVTPLHVAAAAGHTRVVEELLARSSRSVNATTSAGWDACQAHMSMSFDPKLFDAAIERAMQEDVQYMAEESVQPLHCICYSKQSEALFRLARSYFRRTPVSTWDVPSERGWTPLHIAVVRRQSKVAIDLIRMGCNVNTRSLQDTLPILVSAVTMNQYDVVEELLRSGAQPDACSSVVSTALFHACMRNYVPIVELLLRHGASPDGDGLFMPPFHVAALRGYTEVLHVLFEHGVNVNEKNRHGYSALFCAIIGGSARVCAILSSMGCDVDEPCRGWRPVQLAAALKKPEIQRVLQECGATPQCAPRDAGLPPGLEEMITSYVPSSSYMRTGLHST